MNEDDEGTSYISLWTFRELWISLRVLISFIVSCILLMSSQQQMIKSEDGFVGENVRTKNFAVELRTNFVALAI